MARPGKRTLHLRKIGKAGGQTTKRKWELARLALRASRAPCEGEILDPEDVQQFQAKIAALQAAYSTNGELFCRAFRCFVSLAIHRRLETQPHRC